MGRPGLFYIYKSQQQVGGLTADYFLVLPTLLPKLAPANPPVMEGVFNALVSWAALLAFGFLEDGRKPVRRGFEKGGR